MIVVIAASVILPEGANQRIDKLAAEGLRLTNFNVEPECTPTRSALMTGRMPIRSGTSKVPLPGLPQGITPWEYTIAELFHDAGYQSAMSGKWHLGPNPKISCHSFSACIALLSPCRPLAQRTVLGRF